jgi:hypothetical protein
MSPIPLGILAASGGAAGAMELIATQVLSSNPSSITFSSISSDFKHLQIRLITRSTTNGQDLYLQLNSAASLTYRAHSLRGITGSGVSSDAEGGTDRARIGFSGINSDTANDFTPFLIDILDANSSSKNKTVRTISGRTSTFSFATAGLWSLLYPSTQAVNSLTLSMNSPAAFAVGSRFSLFGIRG